ncbi:MAG TPA: response regulator [Pseudolabrys sp.]|jgi:CheY-like chemotaxis protein
MAMSVLLVEDEALISMLVSDWLVELGFDVHEARTADEALDYIGAGGAVDVLFTDINLPGSMTGAELARRARALMPELPVVYASGRYRGDDLGGLVPHSAFVPKPYDQRKLRHVLEQIAIGTAH